MWATSTHLVMGAGNDAQEERSKGPRDAVPRLGMVRSLGGLVVRVHHNDATPRYESARRS